MINNKHFLAKPSLLLTALLLSIQSGAIAAPNNDAGLQSSGATFKQDPTTGKVTFIGSGSPQGIKLPSTVPSFASNPQEKARDFARAYAPLFGVNNPDTNLVAKKSFTIDSLPTVKYQQLYKGIPVFASEINVNLDKTGNLLAMSGEAASNLNLDVKAKVSSAQALKTALGVVKKYYKLTASSVNASTPELNIYQPELIGPGNGRAKLVYLVIVKPKALKPIQQYVFVDATKPNTVALTFNNNPDARNRLTYTANHTEILPGTLVCNEANVTANCAAAGTSDAAKAHTFARDTYDFYFSNHQRDSIDGYGLPLVSTVQFGVNLQNAFWDGIQMVYGDGFSKADDVVGHELTHGVTQYTSNLLYYYQSGAINESFSDVWGEFIDLTNGRGNDTAAVRWKVGEDIPGIGAIRDMKNPPLFGDPDRILSPLYYKDSDDNGGVHFNSGVNNKAVFLMVDGGTFNGKTVVGLGAAKVAKIYYRAQTTLLSSGSNYNDLYTYLNQSCTSLVGTSGITAANCTQVNNALLAVQMNLPPSGGFQPQAALCPAGKTVSNTFFDNVEGSLKWHPLTLAGNNLWTIGTNFAASGTNSLFAADIDGNSDSIAVQKTGVLIPAGAYLYFKHSFDFEAPNYDGGVVEYSIGGTGVWQDARPLFLAGQNYNGTIDTTSGNPLKGRLAFVGVSHGYVSSKYNLASLAGRVVRFRFRQANDASVGAGGWDVDDIRAYRCL